MRFGYFLSGLLFALVSDCPLAAQGASSLYQIDLLQAHSDSLELGMVRYLSDFNPGGYTHQPWVMPDGRILVSVRTKDNPQHDIWSLDPRAGSYWVVTRTKANEFSPRSTPDAAHISVLRQTPGDTPVQQVVRFSPDGGATEVLTPGLTDVGYYTWIDSGNLALFLIAGGTHQLAHYRIRTGTYEIVADRIGRCLVTLPNGEVLFVQKVSESSWSLKAYDPLSGNIRLLAQAPGLTEDFCLLPDGTILMALASNLYALSAESPGVWIRVADLARFGLQRITRLAVTPDGRRLILVNELSGS